jgi:hypothetical protein
VFGTEWFWNLERGYHKWFKYLYFIQIMSVVCLELLSDTGKEFVMNWTEFGNTKFPSSPVVIMLRVTSNIIAVILYNMLKSTL